MSVIKSIINDVELKNGEAYVQISSHRSVLSFDTTDVSFGITLTLKEMEKLVEAINKSLDEAHVLGAEE